jgi:hypothetical protein
VIVNPKRHSGIGNRIPRFPVFLGISRFPIPDSAGTGNRRGPRPGAAPRGFPGLRAPGERDLEPEVSEDSDGDLAARCPTVVASDKNFEQNASGANLQPGRATTVVEVKRAELLVEVL